MSDDGKVEAAHPEHDEEPHVVGSGLFVLVWLGLLTLTAITVSAAGVHLGKLNVWVALTIATVKVLLVLSFFMHLKYEKRVLRVMMVASIVVLAVILGLTFVDTTLWDVVFAE